MIPLDAIEIEQALGVCGVREGATGISTDTRSIRPGDLFVAIKGPSYDGHAFVPAALAEGASGAVVEVGAMLAGGEEWENSVGRHRVHRVRNSVRALGDLARAVRRKSGARVVAVTGSVGKTSTKDLMCAMAQPVCRCLGTKENENNQIGVPLTLLGLDESADIAVVEMGMRSEGEIAELSRIAEPDVGVVTAIAPVHLELLGDLEAISRAKAELLYGVREGGYSVIPVGVSVLERHAERAGHRIIRFGIEGSEADVDVSLSRKGSGTQLRIAWPEGRVVVEAPFTARHRLENTAAAAGGLYAAGLPLEECARGISLVRFSSLRGDAVSAGSVTILNDTYNASPVSVKAALDVLMEKAETDGRRPLAVLGDMLELGEEAIGYHEYIGRHAAAVGVRGLWATGDYAQAVVDGYCGDPRVESDLGAHVMSEGEPGLDEVFACLRPGDLLLVKGSRGLRLERMVEALVARLGGSELVEDEES